MTSYHQTQHGQLQIWRHYICWGVILPYIDTHWNFNISFVDLKNDYSVINLYVPKQYYHWPFNDLYHVSTIFEGIPRKCFNVVSGRVRSLVLVLTVGIPLAFLCLLYISICISFKVVCTFVRVFVNSLVLMCLLIGPPGVGKTLLLKRLNSILFLV